MFDALIRQFGGDLFNAGGEQGDVATDAGVQALTWFADLVKNGTARRTSAQDADAIALQNGKTAFNWNGIWNINTLREKSRIWSGVSPRCRTIGGTARPGPARTSSCLPKQKHRTRTSSTAAQVFIN